ncbi:uncharacterized protein LOC114543919 [Dendronephthya gigantea]|uniref:uncharacterized protein LOC114543919 n=1 Tax=Dendronephthya gigantea TaxID=151771 RepID=UPI001069C18C|nr:uncharacterized protein LOC114543919 [Dendronephthya gigantea]
MPRNVTRNYICSYKQSGESNYWEIRHPEHSCLDFEGIIEEEYQDNDSEDISDVQTLMIAVEGKCYPIEEHSTLFYPLNMEYIAGVANGNCSGRQALGQKLLKDIPFWNENATVAAKRRRIWVNFIRRRRDKWTPTPSSVVCSKHFTNDCFEYGSATVSKYKTPRLKRDELGVSVYPTLQANQILGSTESERTKRMKRRETITESPTTSSKISGVTDELKATTESVVFPTDVMEHESMIGASPQSPHKCRNCDLLKKENKRIRNCWETSKQKLAGVRKELDILRGATGVSSDDDEEVESNDEEDHKSEDETEGPSDDMYEDAEIETETDTADTDTDEDINVPSHR